METDDRQELIRLMKALGTFNPPDFVRSEELGSQMDFREALPLFEGIRDLFGRLADVDLELATDGMLSSLLEHARSLAVEMSRIRKFDPTIPNASNERESMVEQTTYYYDQVKGSGGPLIALSFAWAGGVDLEQVRQSSRELREEMGETLLKSRNDLGGRLAEADSILSAIRSKSAETGVADHAELFKNAACRFKKEKELLANVGQERSGPRHCTGVDEHGLCTVVHQP